MKIAALPRRSFFRSLVASMFLLAAGIGLASPPEGVLDGTHANVRAAMAVQGLVTPDLMTIDGLLGTAVGLDEAGQTALVIFVDQDSPSRAELVRALPPEIRGIALKVHLTDKFRAFAGKPGGAKVSHTAKQSFPIQLGTSGGWRNDLANGYCCGGTLGALVQAGKFQFILSNYHVFEADIVPGGNDLIAATGSYVVQPGLIDVGCTASQAQNVATLVKLSALPKNNVDCAVAQVLPGAVSASILEIGPISSQTVPASLNQAVKKSGRTTGLTRSTVIGLNATISVAYENECAGGPAFTRTFTGQLVMANSGSKFLNSGDSGSLMVEDKTTNPRAVGLLYAGSNTAAIANPIGDVLTFLSSKLGGTATMVGN
jgi:hypothetical protein